MTADQNQLTTDSCRKQKIMMSLAFSKSS